MPVRQINSRVVGAFSHRLMWTPIGLTPPTVVAALAAVVNPRLAHLVLPLVAVASLVDGEARLLFMGSPDELAAREHDEAITIPMACFVLVRARARARPSRFLPPAEPLPPLRRLA